MSGNRFRLGEILENWTDKKKGMKDLSAKLPLVINQKYLSYADIF
jgi:hypothetical protein